MEKRRGIFLVSTFLAIIICVSLGTVYVSFPLIVDSVYNLPVQGVRKTISSVEQTIKDSVWGKRNWVNLNGIALRTLNKNMVGNFEFVKDEYNQIHVVGGPYSPQPFINQMLLLQEELSETQAETPLIYIQVPSEFNKTSNSLVSQVYDYDNGTFDKIHTQLEDKGINTLNVFSEVPPSDLFFKTDVHMKTEAEWEMLLQVVDALETQFDIQFANKDAILNKNNYDILQKDFVGNCAQTVGEYFVGSDIFELYYPKFTTKFTLYDENHSAIKSGPFETVVMNGYSKESNDKYSYLVTNYMQFTRPAYEYTNHELPDGPEILIDMDSYGYRMASYLALMCSKLTVIDSRFDQNGLMMTKKLQSNNYDAVLVLQKNALMPTQLVCDVLVEPQAEIVSHNTPTTIRRNDSYAIDITVENTGDDTWSKDKNVRLCIWQDGIDHGYRIDLPDDIEIAPGEQHTFTLYGFVAPPSSSTYTEFQMLQEGVTYFGERERVDITVID